MGSQPGRIALFVILVIVVVVAAYAVVRFVGQPGDKEVATPTPVSQPEDVAAQATATPILATDTPVPAAPTEEPSATPQHATATPLPPTPTAPPPAPTVSLAERFTVPGEAGEPFVIEATEAEINAFLAEQPVQQEGLDIQEVQIVLNEGLAVIELRLTHVETGINTGLTLRGVPQVVDGVVHAKVTTFEVDDTLSGFARLIVRSLVQTFLDSYDTEAGIPVPTEGVLIESVDLLQGAIRITGKTE